MFAELGFIGVDPTRLANELILIVVLAYIWFIAKTAQQIPPDGRSWFSRWISR